MANGTLHYSSTTITLPRPTIIDRDYVEVVREAVTVGGQLRRTVFSKKYVYTLTFPYATLALYDSIVTMWASAETAWVFPTFTFTSAFASANGTYVSFQIGKFAWTNVPGMGTFTLVLTEVNPR